MGEPNSCGVCKKPAKSKCSRCGKQWYCGTECQKADWKNHKAFCKSITSKATQQPKPKPGVTPPTSANPVGAAAAVTETIKKDIAKANELDKKGDLDGAISAYKTVGEFAKKVLGPTSIDAFICYDEIARIHAKAGRMQESIELMHKQLKAKRDLFGFDHQSTHFTAECLVRCLLERNDMRTAQSILKDLYPAVKRRFGPAHPGTCAMATNYALVLCRNNKFAEAVELGRENLTMCRKVHGPTSLDTLKVGCNLCEAYLRKEEYEEAVKIGSDIQKLAIEVLTEEHPLTSLVTKHLKEAETAKESTFTLDESDLDKIWAPDKTESHPVVAAIANPLRQIFGIPPTFTDQMIVIVAGIVFGATVLLCVGMWVASMPASEPTATEAYEDIEEDINDEL